MNGWKTKKFIELWTNEKQTRDRALVQSKGTNMIYINSTSIIVLYVLFRSTASGYPCGIFKFYLVFCLVFSRSLFVLSSFFVCVAIVLPVLLWFTAPDYPFGMCTLYFVFCLVFYRSLFVLLFCYVWSLYCLFFDLRLLITPVVSLSLIQFFLCSIL